MKAKNCILIALLFFLVFPSNLFSLVYSYSKEDTLQLRKPSFWLYYLNANINLSETAYSKWKKGDKHNSLSPLEFCLVAGAGLEPAAYGLWAGKRRKSQLVNCQAIASIRAHESMLHRWWVVVHILHIHHARQNTCPMVVQTRRFLRNLFGQVLCVDSRWMESLTMNCRTGVRPAEATGAFGNKMDISDTHQR